MTNNTNYKKVMFNPVIHTDIMTSIKEEEEELEVMTILFSSLSL